MKILMIDKFYFVKGGAERYFFELSDILRANGHEVIPFSMKHEENFDTEYEKYFVNNIEYNLDGVFRKAASSFKIFGRMVYSTEAKRKIEKLINATKPDIAHLHMIDHQISPSILDVFDKYGIPVLQTVHQYKLVCPNYRLYNMYKKEICEKCLNGHYFHPVLEKCHKDSRLAGLMIGLEMTIHKRLKIYDKIDLFHVPSFFMGEKLKQAGVDGGKIKHLFYTINLDNYPANFSSEDYIIYYGRLAKEKGILTLLQAMTEVKSIDLLVVGDGPQREELESFVREHHLENVKFLGVKGGKELNSLVANSKFVVIPSEWYDNSPLVIYESCSMGKPVIGAKMGGIPELIDDNKTGLLFEAGDSKELAEKMNYLLASPKLIVEFGKQARKKAEREFSPQVHYQKMLEIYSDLSN